LVTRVVDELVESALRELADGQYQREVWLAAEGPEISSLAECVCRLWDDSGLGHALEANQTVYSAEIDAHLKDLDAVLHRLDQPTSPQAILANPELDQVRTLARSVLVELRHFGLDRQ
jgi:predicted lipoprotein